MNIIYKNINVIFVHRDRIFSILFLENDKIDDVLNKFYMKTGADINNIMFYFNSQPISISCGKTLLELRIGNNYRIYVSDKNDIRGGNI